MKVLVFDTETTGLPKKGDQYSPEQPWVIQLAALYFDMEEDKILHQINTLIIPPAGVIFEPGAVNVHGFSEEVVRENGRSGTEVYTELQQLRQESDCIAAYNISFDERLVRSSSVRENPDLFEPFSVLGNPDEIMHHCIMHQAMSFFGRPREKLETIYKRMMGQSIVNAHDAMADAIAAMEVMKVMLLKQLEEK